MNHALTEYFRCTLPHAEIRTAPELLEEAGFFSVGRSVCFGRLSTPHASKSPRSSLFDAWQYVRIKEDSVELPFDPSEVLDNLRLERYSQIDSKRVVHGNLARSVYRSVRPLLHRSVRKHLQRYYLNDWKSIPFPSWPVDFSVNELMCQLLALVLQAGGQTETPFIWFWPEGKRACVIMTHDVETEFGRNYCGKLMSLDEEYRIPASFQVVPEERYEVPDSYLAEIRARNFEVNVQDLNHDGSLFSDFEQFKRRVSAINEYGRAWGARGFRAALLDRNEEWFGHLNFDYDMSIPNVAHLERQRGGCCTVLPYFIGDLLELPVTTVQDYSLFHILNDHSTTLWLRQIREIVNKNGMVSFITHPDYLQGQREESTYRELLLCLSELRSQEDVWIATPGEVADWWRQRSHMVLTTVDGELRIEGPENGRARIAIAHSHGDSIVYVCDPR